MPAASPPLLPFGRAKPILALCVHLAARSLRLSPTPARTSAAAALATTRLPVLLSRTYAPLVTKAALMHRPDVDLDRAVRDENLRLLKFMVDWSKEPDGRPLHYSSWQIVADALEKDSPRVLEWLVDQPGLFLEWGWGYLLASAMCGKGRVEWREWWQASGSHRFKDRISFAELAIDASRNGRVDILDWLLEQLGADGMVSADKRDSGWGPVSAIGVAAREGHVHVLDWWLAKVQSGTIPTQIDWLGVIKAGFDKGHAAVLEWCKNQPQAVEAWHQVMKGHVRPEWSVETMCANAIEHGIVPWHDDTFNLLRLPFACVSVQASIQACKRGDLELVKELHGMGHLLGSRKVLVQSALESGKLELLDWIQASVDPSSVAVEADSWYHFDPFVTACRAGKVELLDWLIANGYAFPPLVQERRHVFYCAVDGQRIPVLEWLFKNGFANGMSMGDWIECFEAASRQGHLNVLDLLADNISKLFGSPLRPLRRPARPLPTRILYNAFWCGHVDVVEWWLTQSFTVAYDLDHGKPYLDACTQDGGPAHLAALQAWYEADQPMDFADCIHEASIHGRVDVLDWLLHSTSASEEDFVKAWSNDDAYPDEITAGNMYSDYWFDIDNHGKSLAWWRDNLPHVAALPMNRGPYHNPIHAHYHQSMLRNTSFELLEPFHAIEEYDGPVGLLEYWKQTGKAQELEEDADRCLTEASESGYLHVLDWWQASGLKMECPEDVVSGKTRVWKEAKEWWSKSGLISNSELAGIQIR